MDQWDMHGAWSQSILATIRQRGALTLSAIANLIGRGRAFCQNIIDRLVVKGSIKELTIHHRKYFLLATKPFTECECDGTCQQQIIALSNPHHRKLYRHIHLHAPQRFHELTASDDLGRGWNERTLQRRLNRLLDAGLIHKRGDAGDLRSTVYEAADPMDPTVAVLEEAGWAE